MSARFKLKNQNVGSANVLIFISIVSLGSGEGMTAYIYFIQASFFAFRVLNTGYNLQLFSERLFSIKAKLQLYAKIPL